MRTIAVVDVITQYLMTFGPLLGDIKKRVLCLSVYIDCQLLTFSGASSKRLIYGSSFVVSWQKVALFFLRHFLYFACKTFCASVLMQRSK
jgi:hypothetical protein